MANGWRDLGVALGGTSEKAYQEGLALGANTENALAQARERVDKSAARSRMESNLFALTGDRNMSRAAADSLTAGGGLKDPMELLAGKQEYDFRTRMGDPNVPLDNAQRAALGVANGPVEPVYEEGGRLFNKFQTPADVSDLGTVMQPSGGRSSFIQNGIALGVLDPQGNVTDANGDGIINQDDRAIAFEVLRTTGATFDAGGVPMYRTENPFVRKPTATPGAAPAAGAPAAAPPPAAGPATSSLVPVSQVASNKQTLAAATEQGQAQGRNAAGLQTALSSIDNFDRAIDEFTGKKGYAGLYGNLQGTDIGKTVMGLADQDVADARGSLNSLGGKAFLASIQQMRGFGQLSNQEGLKVETALTRALDTRLSEEDSRRAWQEVKIRLQELKRVAQIEAGQGGQGAAPQAPAATGGWSIRPVQ